MKRYSLLLLSVLFCSTAVTVLAQNRVVPPAIKFKGVHSWRSIQDFDKAHYYNHGRKRTANEEEEAEEMPTRKKDQPFIIPSGIAVPSAFRGMAPSLNAAFATPCVNYNGLDDDQSFIPPDISGAVGFDHIMETLNSQVQIKSKDNSIVSTVSLLSFFQALGYAGNDVFDPKIVYDHFSNRWIFLVAHDRSSKASGVLIAVTTTPDPTGNWMLYTIAASAEQDRWFDYPSLGYSSDKFVYTGNMFRMPPDSGGLGSYIYTIKKTDLLDGTLYSTGAIQVFYAEQSTLVPAINYDGDEQVNFVTNDDDAIARIKVHAVDGTPGQANCEFTFRANVTYNSGNGWSSAQIGLPQAGTAVKINAGDNRLLSCVQRGGKIYWAHNIFLPVNNPTYCGAQIASFYASTLQPIEMVGWADPTGASMWAYPNLAVNKYNDVVVAMTRFTTTGYPSAAIAFIPGSAGGLIAGLSGSIDFKTGEAFYIKLDPKKNRWGDYSCAAVDPTDDKGIWVNAEYAKKQTGSGAKLQYNFGTQWAKYCSDVCNTAENVAGTYSAAVKKIEASGTITATCIIQSNSMVKFDAGQRVVMRPGFRVVAGSKFRTYLEGCGGAQ